MTQGSNLNWIAGYISGIPGDVRCGTYSSAVSTLPMKVLRHFDADHSRQGGPAPALLGTPPLRDPEVHEGRTGCPDGLGDPPHLVRRLRSRGRERLCVYQWHSVDPRLPRSADTVMAPARRTLLVCPALEAEPPLESGHLRWQAERVPDGV